MVTGTGSKGSLLVFAQSKDGKRVPMFVSVSPMHNEAGEVIGGVETFRDASSMISDLERAKAIQQLALEKDLTEDPRVRFTTHYIPNEIIGGDYYAIGKIDDDKYGLMLADVMGHGIAAALYTMHLSSLWNRYHDMLANPAEFLANLNNDLTMVVKTDESFATAVCGVIDLKKGEFRFAGAGGPPVLLTHADGSHDSLEGSGLPLAVMEDADYEESSVKIAEGDRLLLFSDGVIEVCDSSGEMLGTEGLIGILEAQDYPQKDIHMDTLENELLKYSNSIRLEDDLTLVEVCLERD
jgi:serine phosphatase RsbU (regulator of sigma subunit)